MKQANTVQLRDKAGMLEELTKACDVPELRDALFPPLLEKAGQSMSLEAAGLLVLTTLGNYCQSAPSIFPRTYELLGPQLIGAILADQFLAKIITDKINSRVSQMIV